MKTKMGVVVANGRGHDSGFGQGRQLPPKRILRAAEPANLSLDVRGYTSDAPRLCVG